MASVDPEDVAWVVFEDPDVVGILAHNTQTSKTTLDEAARCTPMVRVAFGTRAVWGVLAITPRDCGAASMGVAGFYMKRNDHGRWNGEYFYALETACYGKGLMSEAAAFSDRLARMDDLGVIYAAYWDMINEASGRVLRKTGLTPQGRKPARSEYGAERCLSMFDYGLWRLRAAGSADQARLLVEASRRAAAFVAEGIVSEQEELAGLCAAAEVPQLTPEAANIFARAVAHPGIAYLDIRGYGATETPVNVLR